MSAHILIVDDEGDLRNLLALVLHSQGYTTATAADGREALEAITRQAPDLILLDMHMPVMDGWAFARELRRLGGPYPPIIVVTASEEAERRARDIGAEAWLSKPFDLDHLITTVSRQLARRQSSS